MSKAHIDILPVVSRSNINKLEGVITLREGLDSYGVDSVGSA
jgi:CBS domain-containing protein